MRNVQQMDKKQPLSFRLPFGQGFYLVHPTKPIAIACDEFHNENQANLHPKSVNFASPKITNNWSWFLCDIYNPRFKNGNIDHPHLKIHHY